MIFFENQGIISSISLTVLVLFYLILIELGNDNLKKILKPVIIVLISIFLIMAIATIASKV